MRVKVAMVGTIALAVCGGCTTPVPETSPSPMAASSSSGGGGAATSGNPAQEAMKSSSPSTFAGVAQAAPLPTTELHASALLWHSRADVRRVVGKRPDARGAVGSLGATDRFLLSENVSLMVEYKSGKAVSVLLEALPGPLAVPQALAWLGLPPNAPLKVTGDADAPGASKEATMDVAGKAVEVDVIDSAVTVTDAKYAAAQKEAQHKQLQKVGRQELATALEENLLQDGEDATVRANGVTLRITWALCSRATLYQLLNGTSKGLFKQLEAASFVDGLSALGFKRIECSDGYENTAWSPIQ